MPALELLDARGRVAAVLRLDLAIGDPRFDLARTKELLRDRLAERTDAEKESRKEFDDVENAYQRALLEKKAPQVIQEWNEKLNGKARVLGHNRAAINLYRELDKQVAALQLRYPATTIVKDGGETVANPLVAKHQQFRFAGQWLFHYGLLTLYQDKKGMVVGTFTGKVFHLAGRYAVNEEKEASQTAIVSGHVDGSTLTFTMMDTDRKERMGKIVLDADALGGIWSLDAAVLSNIVEALNTPEGKRTGGQKGLLTQYAKNPKAPALGYEPPAQGRVDRLDVGFPDAAWFQEVEMGPFAGYWVHATDKANNTLLKPIRSGVFEGANGDTAVRGRGNVKGAAAGNVMFIVQNPGYGPAASVREAALSADGQKLTFDPVAEKAPIRGPSLGAVPSKNPSIPAQKGIELTRQN